MNQQPLSSTRSLSRRRMTALLAAACLSWGAATAHAQKVVPVSPEARTFKLGAFEVTPLSDNSLEVPNNLSVFGLNASVDAVADVLRESGAPTDTIKLNIDSLLVRAGDHVILFDTGMGSGAHGVLMESLAAAGVTPGSVTDIFITHSHMDHIGGLVGGDGKSAFPHATIRMSEKEWEHLKGQESNGPLVAAIESRVKPFAPGAPVLPGITPMALYGHTPGHVIYRIESQGKTLVDFGDTAHSYIVSLARPDWTIRFDGDKQLGVEQREKELQKLADNHTLIFAVHFPYPGIGHIEHAGDGFRFKPAFPTEK